MFRSPTLSPFQNPFPTEGAAAAVATLAEVYRDDYNMSEIWPLGNISSGTNIPAFINAARDGTLTGWDLQNAAGAVTDSLAPYSDGANDHGNILTSDGSNGLVDIFDGNNFSWFGLAKFDPTASARRLFRIFVDASNHISVYFTNYSSPNVDMFSTVRMQGVSTKNISQTITSPADWFSYAVTIDKDADEIKAYYQGLQYSSTITNLGTFTGTINVAEIGSLLSTPTQVWPGWLQYKSVKFGAVLTSGEVLGMHNAVATALPD